MAKDRQVFKSATKANEYIAAHSDDAPIAVPVKAVEKPKPAVPAPAKSKQQNTQQGRTVVYSSISYMVQTKKAQIRMNGVFHFADVRELADGYVILSIPLHSGGKLIEKVYL